MSKYDPIKGRKYYLKNRKKLIAKSLAYGRSHKKWRLEYNRKYHKIRTQRCKEAILKLYGNKCVCCGESEPVFLSIDHINKDGQKEREHFYENLLKLGKRRNDLRVLCMNCQFGTMRREQCPHQEKNRASSRSI